MTNKTKPSNKPKQYRYRHGSESGMSDPEDLLASCNDAIPFDNFEVQGVIRRRWSIPVDDTDAEYWTIIGYISGKQMCGIGRFASRAEAEEFCKGLYRHKKSA